jgi:hypothetical protein
MNGDTKPTLLCGRWRFTLTVREQWLATLSGKAPEDDTE